MARRSGILRVSPLIGLLKGRWINMPIAEQDPLRVRVNDENEVKRQVREFYNQVGWQVVSAEPGAGPAAGPSDMLYQNARYEDLRPVAREYIHRCHLRVGRHLKPGGRYLLDAGSGPIQYPEYLTYSAGYTYRVCLDISMVALQEARKRIGDRGLFVVADVANLPFRPGVFEGEVSLHTLHHLAEHDQVRAYAELNRVLAPGCTAVIVNGWSESRLMKNLNWLVTGLDRLRAWMARLRGRRAPVSAQLKPAEGAAQAEGPRQGAEPARGAAQAASPVGTFVQKIDAPWLKKQLTGQMKFEILVWRSPSVRFLRAVILPALGGRLWLRLLFWLEDRFPHYFGENGQYPLVVIWKE
jgi:SAM-dependent methyltransferase